jgi:hypothetical protein
LLHIANSAQLPRAASPRCVYPAALLTIGESPREIARWGATEKGRFLSLKEFLDFFAAWRCLVDSVRYHFVCLLDISSEEGTFADKHVRGFLVCEETTER